MSSKKRKPSKASKPKAAPSRIERRSKPAKVTAKQAADRPSAKAPASERPGKKPEKESRPRGGPHAKASPARKARANQGNDTDVLATSTDSKPRKKTRAGKVVAAPSTPAIGGVFGPPPACFSRFTVEGFQEVIGHLVLEEARRVGIPSEDVVTHLNTFTADGGIDAEVRSVPSAMSSFLGVGRPCIFQFKRAALTPSKAAREIEAHPLVQAKLKLGWAYRLVVGTEARNEDALQKSLVAAARPYAGASVDIKVIGPSALSNWFCQHLALTGHPAFAQAGAPKLGGLQTFARWAQGNEHRALPWTPDAQRTELLDRLKPALDVPGSALRVTGLAGTGKTRFVLELVRAAKREHATLYGADVDTSFDDLLNKGPSPENRHLVLVVDECDEREHERLVRRRPPDSTITIITIGVADDTAMAFEESNVLYPLELATTTRLVESMAGTSDPRRVQEIAKKSEGYPKLARVLTDLADRDPNALYALRHNRHGQLVRLLSRMVGGGQAGGDVALRALCLASRLGWKDAPRDQLRSLAEAVREPEDELMRAKRSLKSRGLVGTAGRYIYVTPRLLAEWLAADLWRERGASLFTDLRKARVPHDLLVSIVMRLADVGRGDGLSEVVGDIVGDSSFLGGLSALEDPAKGEILAELATVRPGEATDIIRRSFHQGSTETLNRVGRSILRALQKGAWARESFVHAAGALLGLALLDGDTDTAKEAGEAFTDLFRTMLGSTEANGDERLAVLQEAWTSELEPQRLLVIAAVQKALDFDTTGRASPFPEGARPTRHPWRPEPQAARAYWTGAVHLLTQALSSAAAPEHIRAEAATVRVLRSLFAHGLGTEASRLVELWGPRARTNLELLQAVDTIESFDRKRLSEADVAALVSLRHQLAPTGLDERVVAMVGPTNWSWDRTADDAAYNALAQALVADPSALSESRWEWLNSREAIHAVDLGRALSGADPSARLLPDLVRRARSKDFARLLTGYAIGRPGDEADALLNRWISDEPSLGRVILDSTLFLPSSSAAVARVLRLVSAERVSVPSLEALKFGGWLPGLSVDDVVLVIGAAKPEPIVALTLLFQRLSVGPKGQLDDPKMEALAIEVWCGVDSKALLASQSTISFYWKELGVALGARRPASVAGHALCVVVGASRDGSFAPDEPSEVLWVAWRAAPEEVWPEIEKYLNSATHESIPLGNSIRSGFPESEAFGSILGWVGLDALRGNIAAQLSTAPTDAAESLGAALLDRFPHDKRIASTLYQAFLEGGIAGPISEHLADNVATLDSLSRSQRPGLAKWARQLAESERAAMKGAKILDEELAVGVFPDRSNG